MTGEKFNKTIMKLLRIIVFFAYIFGLLLPGLSLAQADFNPNLIITDEEMQMCSALGVNEIQKFLEAKGSYLSTYSALDIDNAYKSAAQIIYEAAQRNKINPKFLLVTLQKEQSLITDDSPTQKQLDWATGYAVCDSCSMNDPKIQKHKGFANQVDNAAGIIRWYYENTNNGIVKKINSPVFIDNQQVVPQSWATAFLYTYTPHLHGNKNFWRIWNTWFAGVYPNGTILLSASSSQYYLVSDGKKRLFKNKNVLISRIDPSLAVVISDIDLNNYSDGTPISYPNYSILKTESGYYLLDYDTLRPFADEQTVKKLGYNPQEILEASDADFVGYEIGQTITASTTNPQGIIYKITDAQNAHFLLKDGTLFPLLSAEVAKTNFPGLSIENHLKKEILKYPISDKLITFTDGTLLKMKDSKTLYVVDKNKKRKISDEETFSAMGYNVKNLITVELSTLLAMAEGEPLYVNNSLASSQNKFLGDSEVPVEDLYRSNLPSYLVAEYPSGRIISGKNIDTQRPIASLTKIITAYEALSSDFNLTKTSIFNSKTQTAEGNPLKLTNGDKIKNKDLLYGMLVGSANNASRMIAQNSGVAENVFIQNMNARLQNWGADNTTLNDTSGLSEKNVSTARDLLKIFTKVLDKKEIKEALSLKTYKFSKTSGKTTNYLTLSNTNKLLDSTKNLYKITASKTGYTQEAGSTLIMLIEAPSKDKISLLSEKLKFGERSSKVKELQGLLRTAGFFKHPSDSGYYGTVTKEALDKYLKSLNKKQFIVITLGNPDYNNRFVEPDKIAQWAAAEKYAQLASQK
ncbi:MAG TPA: serine hydrolase [Candidatus Magasanikbacteria bacterium]|nr:serine hydrolase [Candidatus Magasanikbacteria bacterium]